MKHGAVWSGLLGSFAALGFLSFWEYVFSFPPHRHPFGYPWSRAGCITAFLVCLAALCMRIYYITQTGRGARVRTIFSGAAVGTVAFLASLFLWGGAAIMLEALLHSTLSLPEAAYLLVLSLAGAALTVCPALGVHLLLRAKKEGRFSAAGALLLAVGALLIAGALHFIFI